MPTTNFLLSAQFVFHAPTTVTTTHHYYPTTSAPWQSQPKTSSVAHLCSTLPRPSQPPTITTRQLLHHGNCSQKHLTSHTQLRYQHETTPQHLRNLPPMPTRQDSWLLCWNNFNTARHPSQPAGGLCELRVSPYPAKTQRRLPFNSLANSTTIVASGERPC
jgi:hypothetical protein